MIRLERDTHVVTNGFTLTIEMAGKVIDDEVPPPGAATIHLTDDTKIQAAGFSVWITHPDIAPKEKKMSEIVDQPPPAARPDLTPAWEMVINDYMERTKDADDISAVRDVLDDMTARDQTGRERYGVPLTAYNGRDQLIDAYQEMLDGAVYLRAAIDEGLPVEHIYHRTLDNITFLRVYINERKQS